MEVKETITLKGKYKFTKAFLETPEQFALNDEIKSRQAAIEQVKKDFDLANKPWYIQRRAWLERQEVCERRLDYMPLVRHLNSICRTEIIEKDNLIPDIYRAALANWISNASPSPASIRLNYTALGTGTNAPANGDTQLQTETYRKVIASETNVGKVVYASAFYAATEPGAGSVNYKEAGIFANATATANSGTLASRIAINIVKDNTVTLTVDYTITLN